jgi:16S rRNA (uracil1498-N3)-methyltransferase
VRQKNLIPRLPYQVTLIQAIPKGKLFDAIVQKATELGVARIVPLLSERVVTQLDDEKADAKAEHWRTTAIEAIKQCGSAWLPTIDIPITLKSFLARSDSFDLALVGSLQPGSRHPRHWFQEFQQAHGKLPSTVAIWVGPEGDFTADEIATLQSAEVRPITLGPLVLRSETAATYCLSVLNYELSALTV